jgi:ABC-type multidrug transport system fused ATPase/permease subunit
VALRYRDNLELSLKNISFKIGSGMKVGIAGRTGSGKSTTAVTFQRIIELEQGKITFDGVDISKVSLK